MDAMDLLLCLGGGIGGGVSNDCVKSSVAGNCVADADPFCCVANNCVDGCSDNGCVDEDKAVVGSKLFTLRLRFRSGKKRNFWEIKKETKYF